MNVVDDASSLSEPGYTTPPLSPSKTISTEGWSSPRTPASPRKSRSCLLFGTAGSGHEKAFFSPPPYSTKSKCAARLGTLSIPEILSPTYDATPSNVSDDSPSKQDLPTINRLHLRRSLDGTRSTSRSFLAPVDHAEVMKRQAVPLLCPSRTTRHSKNGRRQRPSYRSSSDGSIDTLVAKYATPPVTSIDLDTSNDRNTNSFISDFELTAKLGRSSNRASSSPLRPSQWVARGGFLSIPRKPRVSTPDRFIHCRRPPAVTRESFELNRPEQREQVSRSGRRVRVDPFSRRMHRSDRLNIELQGLREAHTGVTGRPGGNDRTSNPRLRSNSLVTAARQISAGAIWNVGGAAAAGDTVTAVSTGNGGMYGSGTTAPLYTSTFLDRADPEAELEAYERRIALALEVDQTDRILQHSPLPASPPSTRSINESTHRPHLWRDGAWAQDGVTRSSRSSLAH